MIRVILMLVFGGLSAQAVSVESDSVIADPVKKGQAQQQENPPIAQMYGLNESEWNWYQVLMKGPIGNTNPDINPLLALAMAAKNENETRRYLELFAQQKHDYTERMLYLARLWPELYFRLYPDLPIDPTRLGLPDNTVQRDDRLILVTSQQCNCPNKIRNALRRSAIFPLNAVDVFVQDADSDDALTAFAKANVPDSEVARVTINPANEYLSSVLSEHRPAALLLRRGERLLVVPGLQDWLK